MQQRDQSCKLPLDGEEERYDSDTSIDEMAEAWSPHRTSARVASAATGLVAAAAVEEVNRLRAELADRDRQIAELLRSREHGK